MAAILLSLKHDVMRVIATNISSSVSISIGKARGSFRLLLSVKLWFVPNWLWAVSCESQFSAQQDISLV